MKKYAVFAALSACFLSQNVNAGPVRYHHFDNRYYHHYHWNHRHWHNHNWNWVAPAIVGGAILYHLNRPVVRVEPFPETTIIHSPSIIHTAPVIQTCTEWREILQPDGTIVKERTCNIPN